MCGIVGYIGQKSIDQVLLGALSRLEYRGYDSAGLAAVHNDEVSLLKTSGKLDALKAHAAGRPLAGNVGIGHTRWATHGEPTQRNAHPHLDCTASVAVVHNGIIENHESIRARLTDQGHRFSSDTDSEVLAHLIEEYQLRQGLDLERAVRATLNDIKGSYAFCVVSARDQDRFVAARNGSPLVIGIGEGENFVASDAPAILDHTRDAIFLEDYQMAVVRRDDVKVTSTSGAPVSCKVSRIDWDAKDASKDGFDHYMLKEIEEQPGVLRRMAAVRLLKDSHRSGLRENAGSLPLDKSLFDVLRFELSELKQTERVLIQACGTSWHAALTGKFMFESLAGLPTEVDVSSEFRYRQLIPQKKTLVLSITQSGETIDSLMALRHGKERGFRTLSICNVRGSTIARESDGAIYTHAGPEIGVASTKAYTAQLGILFLLALFWGRAWGHLTVSAYEELINEFTLLPEKMQTIIGRKNSIQDVAARYFDRRDFLFLGRGINYPNAHEGALKIKEIAYIHATGHPAGEMKHGPIALIDPEMPVVAIAPRTCVHEKMMSNIREVKARSGRLIAVVNDEDRSLDAIADDIIRVPATNEFLTPFLTVLPLQYLAYFVATLRGTDVDQPRNLAKSVTVE